METFKVSGKNTELHMDKDGVITISGENIKLIPVDGKCKGCSRCMDIDDLITELQMNTRFRIFINSIM